MIRSIHFKFYENDGAFQIESETAGAESFTLNIERCTIPETAQVRDEPIATPTPAPKRRRPTPKPKKATTRRR